MIKHIFIVAIRNLRKYYQQTLISSIGLAVGFICFALSAYWIRYATSFDTFHKNADRIYQVRTIEPEQTRTGTSTPPAFKILLEKHYPEIQATTVDFRYYPIKNEEDKRIIVLQTDSTFFHTFDVTVLSGSLQDDDMNGLLITEKFAKERFPDSSPLGQTIPVIDSHFTSTDEKTYVVKGIVKDWPTNTILTFDAIAPLPPDKRTSWGEYTSNYILLDKSTDSRTFKDKFEKDPFNDRPDDALKNIGYFTLFPLTEIYSSNTDGNYNRGQLTFEQVTFFALLGLLTIICGLLNYLNLYASRIQARFKELSLRKVNGAGNTDIFGILVAEFILLTGISLVFGFIGIEYFLPRFKDFADIKSDRIQIYLELFTYTGFILCIYLLSISGVIYYSRKKLFRESVRMASPVKGKSLFGRISILIQMIISLGIACGTAIYFKQIYTIGHKNPGFDRENVLTIHIGEATKTAWSSTFRYTGCNDSEMNLLVNELKNNPAVTDITKLNNGGELFPRSIDLKKATTEEMDEDQGVEFDRFHITADYIRFHRMQLIAGNDFKEDDEDNSEKIIINETIAKSLGLKDPLGKIIISKGLMTIQKSGGEAYDPLYKIIGVVKDFAYELPTMKIRPVIMFYSNSYDGLSIRYKPGTKQALTEEIKAFVTQNLPGKSARFTDVNELYKYTYRKEASLQTLIALLSAVCIIISLFGVYSMVSLHAERRRKEIAIRKVNGATLFSIFNLFFKEYILMLAIAAAIAFPAGYIILKPWTERYVLQTEISWWIFALLFLSTAAVVLLTITARVWNTAHINPASELKKE